MKKEIKSANYHKELLKEVIFFMLEDDNRREAIVKGYADFNYNFTNTLAKYYNANDSCLISLESFTDLILSEVDLEKKYTRGTFRGSVKYKGEKNFKEQTPLQRVKGKFMFDHNPPVNIIRNKLLDVNKDGWRKTATEKILRKYEDCVFMLTRDEDDELKKTKNEEVNLNSNMPDEWAWGDDEKIRYEKCKIEITDIRIYFNSNKIPR